jgi:hypothetical protein
MNSRSSPAVKASFQARTDLSLVLLGFTNNPVAMRPSLAVAGNGKGLHALFGVTNTSTNHFIQFKTIGIERRHETDWKEFVTFSGWPTNPWTGLRGQTWGPGFGCACAVAWPLDLPTNAAWRLRLSVSRERSLPLIALNQRLGREFFQPYQAQTLNGPEVSLQPIEAADTNNFITFRHLKTGEFNNQGNISYGTHFWATNHTANTVSVTLFAIE